MTDVRAGERTLHRYSPDYQAMGDCRTCGHAFDDADPFHYPAGEVPAERQLTLPTAGEPRAWVVERPTRGRATYLVTAPTSWEAEYAVERGEGDEVEHTNVWIGRARARPDAPARVRR